MRADVLIAQLVGRGVTLAAEGDRLRCRPRSALTDRDLQLLKVHKAAVLTALARDSEKSRMVCSVCHERLLWRSVYGELICGVCHPPASPRLVVGWLGHSAAEGD